MPLAHLGPELEVEYDLEGRGDPVTLVCGLGVQRGVWQEVVDELGGSFQLLTYDLRGYRGSSPPDPFTIADLAGDLVRLLDRLGTGPVHLVGHSQGGFIALEATLARPDLVRSLVLAGSASYTDEYGRHVLQSWRDTLLHQGQKAFYENIFLWHYSPDYFNDRTQELKMMKKWLSRSSFPVDTYLAHNRACESHETRDRLRALDLPTLLLGGAEDRVMGLRHNRLLHELITGSRVVTLDRLGHDLFVESPYRTLPHIADFLAAQGRRKAVRAAAGGGESTL